MQTSSAITFISMKHAAFLAISCALIFIDAAGDNSYNRLFWCKKKLNPREFATAMRKATEVMFACKDIIMKLNLSPQILKEHRRLCVALRICYAYSSYSNKTIHEMRQAFSFCMRTVFEMIDAAAPDLLAQYRINVTLLVEGASKCGLKHVPREEKYALAITGYFADFISG
nr:uncharacterized protein LOC126518505 isoform X1 [Dermacentor andersoni]